MKTNKNIFCVVVSQSVFIINFIQFERKLIISVEDCLFLNFHMSKPLQVEQEQSTLHALNKVTVRNSVQVI